MAYRIYRCCAIIPALGGESMTDSKTSTKSNTQNAQPQKVPHFSAAAVKRAKNAKASARLLEAMKFIKAEASVA